MTTPPKRRWLRFSLRTMLVVVTVMAGLLGMLAWKVHQARRQKAVVAWVRDGGGAVQYDFRPTSPDDLPGPDWLCEMIGIDLCAKVDTILVKFDNHSKDLSPLAKLPYLEHLELEGESGAALPTLPVLPNLVGLRVANTKVESLSSFTRLTNLRVLHLDKTQVDDPTQSPNLTKLMILRLDEARFTEKEIAELQKALPKSVVGDDSAPQYR